MILPFVYISATVINGQHNAAKDADLLLPKHQRHRTRPRLAKALEQPDRQGRGPESDTGTVAVAGRDAAVPDDGAAPWEFPHRHLPSNRIAGMLPCLHGGALVALRFITKTPDDELSSARKPQKELKS